GVVVYDLVQGGPADLSGIGVDDILLSIDGQTVTTPQEVSQIVRAHSAGDVLSLNVIQQGQERALDVTLAPTGDLQIWSRPASDSPPIMGAIPQPSPQMNPPAMAQREARFVFVENGETIEVGISGDPSSPDAAVTVDHGADHYEVTVGTLGELPKELASVSQRSVEAARGGAAPGLGLGQFGLGRLLPADPFGVDPFALDPFFQQDPRIEQLFQAHRRMVQQMLHRPEPAPMAPQTTPPGQTI
ncbi:MAG: PDZ domain-containing protein, partial [Myxococcales bacterium]|nr:PDZ domain-containing protein [Myxococcales bacterium]